MNEIAGVPADSVQIDKSFIDDLDIDSLSMVEVVVAAEEKFGVKIPDDDVKSLQTVGDAVTYIAEGQRLTAGTADAPTRGGRPTWASRPTATKHRGVTGLGASSPLGGDVASTWAGMLAGRSGVRTLTQEWAADLPVRSPARSPSTRSR